MNVLIIEDEARTGKDLKKMLEHIDSDLRVIEILPSVETALQWFKENGSPDLIFSDIQLGDGLSFDIFRQVKTTAPVIFCTAFDEYAIRAFESNSIDYLLKPIEEEMLEKSLEKYDRVRHHFNPDQQQYGQNLSKVLIQMDKSYKKSLLVHFREKIIPVKVGEICYIYSSGGEVSLRTIYKTDYQVQYSMDQLESQLDPQFFFKANRQFLVNRDAIQNVEHYFNRRLFVKLTCETPDKIIVSKTKAQEFLEWMEG